MNELSKEELYELYLDTLNRCGAFLLEKDDETIGYEIFEEFIIGAISYLHENSVGVLHQAGYISETKMKKSLELRGLVMEVDGTDEWNIQSVRTSPKWREILVLADEIKKLK